MVHLAMAALFLTNIIRGLSLLLSLYLRRPIYIDVGGALNCSVLMLYAGVMLADMILDRMPAQAWARVHRMQARFIALSRCHGRSGGVLATLAAEGATVIAPGEGPQVVAELMQGSFAGPFDRLI